MLDMALSPVFYRLALGRRVGLLDVRRLDPALGASLEKLSAAAAAHEARGGGGPLLVDGCPLQDLCLSFELPGYPEHPLAGGGGDVTPANLRAYIDAVVDATLGSGVATQVRARGASGRARRASPSRGSPAPGRCPAAPQRAARPHASPPAASPP